jgi:hypothetical protein
LPAYELGNDNLVHDRVSVSHDGGDAFGRLVEAARGLGPSSVFLCGHCDSALRVL